MADVSGWMKVDGERDNDDVDGDSDNGDSEVIDARDNPLPLRDLCIMKESMLMTVVPDCLTTRSCFSSESSHILPNWRTKKMGKKSQGRFKGLNSVYFSRFFGITSLV